MLHAYWLSDGISCAGMENYYKKRLLYTWTELCDGSRRIPGRRHPCKRRGWEQKPGERFSSNTVELSVCGHSTEIPKACVRGHCGKNPPPLPRQEVTHVNFCGVELAVLRNALFGREQCCLLFGLR